MARGERNLRAGRYCRCRCRRRRRAGRARTTRTGPCVRAKLPVQGRTRGLCLSPHGAGWSLNPVQYCPSAKASCSVYPGRPGHSALREHLHRVYEVSWDLLGRSPATRRSSCQNRPGAAYERPRRRPQPRGPPHRPSQHLAIPSHRRWARKGGYQNKEKQRVMSVMSSRPRSMAWVLTPRRMQRHRNETLNSGPAR